MRLSRFFALCDERVLDPHGSFARAVHDPPLRRHISISLTSAPVLDVAGRPFPRPEKQGVFYTQSSLRRLGASHRRPKGYFPRTSLAFYRASPKSVELPIALRASFTHQKAFLALYLVEPGARSPASPSVQPRVDFIFSRDRSTRSPVTASASPELLLRLPCDREDAFAL